VSVAPIASRKEVITAMTKPTAHVASEDEVPELPVLGWVQVLVHALERGQCESRVCWPDDALGDDAEGAGRRQRFAQFVIAELEADRAKI
jgi:hypothetical protein